MDEIATALAEQNKELAALLAGRSERDWERPVPSCEGWTVADVVLHIAQTNELAIASAENRLPEVADGLAGGDATRENVDDAADVMVVRERGAPVAELFERWQTGADRFLDIVDGTDLHRRVMWVAGQLSVRTLIATRLAETWIHTTDVAEGLDVELAPGDRLRYVARLAWRTLPYAFARSGRELTGPVAFELRGPNGDAWDFVPDEPPVTVVRGDGVELCRVAARRVEPADTSLVGEGPDADAVLELVRTYA